MAKYYVTKKDGTKEAITIQELKVKLFSGEIEPSDVDFKCLIGALPKEKKDLEQTLDVVVQMQNARKKAAADEIDEKAKKAADAQVKDVEISKIQRKLEAASTKAQLSAVDFKEAKEMLDLDPSNKEKMDYYAMCRKQLYLDYVEVYKIEGELRKKENPDDSSVDDSIKRRIKGLELKLGISSSVADPVVDPIVAPVVAPSPVTGTTRTKSSIVIEPYKRPDGVIVNTVLCHSGEPISEDELRRALKSWGANLSNVTVNEAAEYEGQILVGNEIPELSAFRRKKLS